MTTVFMIFEHGGRAWRGRQLADDPLLWSDECSVDYYHPAGSVIGTPVVRTDTRWTARSGGFFAFHPAYGQAGVDAGVGLAKKWMTHAMYGDRHKWAPYFYKDGWSSSPVVMVGSVNGDAEYSGSPETIKRVRMESVSWSWSSRSDATARLYSQACRDQHGRVQDTIDEWFRDCVAGRDVRPAHEAFTQARREFMQRSSNGITPVGPGARYLDAVLDGLETQLETALL